MVPPERSTDGAVQVSEGTHRNLVGQVLNITAAYREVVHERGSTFSPQALTHPVAFWHKTLNKSPDDFC